jgi:DNA-directed RNA polymerase specialized sigma24 family protein
VGEDGVERDWLGWRAWVCRWFRRRILDRHLVDELAQEACLRAWESRCTGRVREVSLPWVAGISSNLLGAHFRREYGRRRPRHPGPLEEIPAEPRQRMVRVGLRSYPLARLLVVLDACLAQLPLANSRWLRSPTATGCPFRWSSCACSEAGSG